MSKAKGRKSPATTIPTGSVAVFEADAATYRPAEPEYAPRTDAAGRAAMWRSFIRQYATPLADSPGWFGGNGPEDQVEYDERVNFHIELVPVPRPGPLPPWEVFEYSRPQLRATEVNPTADDLLVLRTRRLVRTARDGEAPVIREQIDTSAVPWEQVGRISVLT